MNIKIIYGSDTENTSYVIDTYLLNLLEKEYEVEVVNLTNIQPTDWDTEDFIILGVPTWYDGLLQSDWEDYFETFDQIDFTGKTLAIFGLGDQIGYAEYFADGVGILAKSILKNGGKVIGHWPNKGYEFEESKSLINDDMFYGLVLDEDNQDNLTQERCIEWVKNLKKLVK